MSSGKYKEKDENFSIAKMRFEDYASRYELFNEEEGEFYMLKFPIDIVDFSTYEAIFQDYFFAEPHATFFHKKTGKLILSRSQRFIEEIERLYGELLLSAYNKFIEARGNPFHVTPQG